MPTMSGFEFLVEFQKLPKEVQEQYKIYMLTSSIEDFFGLYKRFHDHIEGKGMGLFLVKTQVELLGGKISIVSEVNAGTKFTITFKEKSLNYIS